MTLSEYFKHSKPDLPPLGTAGTETHWLPVTSFRVSNGSLWAGDPYVVNAEAGILIDVPNGEYALEARGMDFAGRRVVSRIRAYLNTVQPHTVNQQIGDTCTDTGMIAVCDLRALNEAIQGQDDAFQDAVMNHNYQNCGLIQIHAGRGFDLPYVSTAFGDAGGKVFEIESGGIRVGFELEFLAPGYTYDEYG
jgi:hypothetical protein